MSERMITDAELAERRLSWKWPNRSFVTRERKSEHYRLHALLETQEPAILARLAEAERLLRRHYIAHRYRNQANDHVCQLCDETKAYFLVEVGE